MGNLAPFWNWTQYKDILSKLKHLFDPNNVIAPGRYEFWSRDHKIKHIDT